MGRAESRRLTGLWCNDSASLGGPIPGLFVLQEQEK